MGGLCLHSKDQLMSSAGEEGLLLVVFGCWCFCLCFQLVVFSGGGVDSQWCFLVLAFASGAALVVVLSAGGVFCRWVLVAILALIFW